MTGRLIGALVVAASLLLGAAHAVLAQSRAASATRVASAPAAVPAGGPAWGTLTPTQRAALAPLEREWSAIDEPRKQKWLEIAARYPALPEAERRRLHERMTEWARLTPAERARARLSFQEAKQLPAQERQARWEAYQALPVEQRRALAERGSAKAADRSRVPVAASAPAGPASAAASGAARASTRAVAVKPVSPAIVQAKPGATTTPVNRIALPASQPATPGQPRIAASPNQVDRKTLLPRVGPQSPAGASATGQPQTPSTAIPRAIQTGASAPEQPAAAAASSP